MPVALDYRNRNVIQRCYCPIMFWLGLATRRDKPAVDHGAAADINAAVAWTTAL